MGDWLDRQSFLGCNSMETLARARVAILGLGGGGSHISQQLAHAGLGNLKLFDPDHIELSNLNRVVGAVRRDIEEKTLKVEIASRLATSVNPSITATRIASRWQAEAHELVDCSAIVGCVDSFKERAEIELEARRLFIPYVDIGMDVTLVDGRPVVSGQAVLSVTGGPCLRCLGIVTDKRLTLEAQRYGIAGPRPQVIWANGVLASTAVGMVIALLTNWHGQPQITCFDYDGNTGTITASPRLEYVGDCQHYVEFDESLIG